MNKKINKIPFSIATEEALIGGIFYNIDLFSEILEKINYEDFYKKEHSLIFKAMTEIYSKGSTIDPVLVLETIKKQNTNSSSVEETLSDIIDRILCSYNLIEYAEIIYEKSLLRKLADRANKIIEISYNEEKSASSTIEEAEELIYSVAKRINNKEVVTLKSIMLEEIERIESLYSNPKKTLGMSTGFQEFDKMTSGLNNSDLIILAGRPAMGKTAFALNLILNVAEKENKNILFFSLEMSKSQLFQRLLSIRTGIYLNKIRNGNLQDDDWGMLGKGYEILSRLKLNIADYPNASIPEIRSMARKLKSKGNLDLIVIDYLQLIKGSEKAGTRQEEIADISRALKGIARELDVPVIALSQLSRAVETRMDKRPMLSDLRESGAIEQDADIVGFLYRDEYYNSDTADKGIAELIIGKQRNGSTGTIKFNFLQEFTKFTDI